MDMGKELPVLFLCLRVHFWATRLLIGLIFLVVEREVKVQLLISIPFFKESS